MRWAGLIVLAAVIAWPALAEETAGRKDYTSVRGMTEFEALPGGHDLMAIYFHAVDDALGYGNFYLTARGGAPFFCPPAKLALNAGNYRKILLDEVARLRRLKPANKEWQDKIDRSNIGMILVDALYRTFPCK
ncbi:MAG: hypothetical protein IH626_17645 [Rhodospirillales bacterium]|nr:hypothetical protein [Rhodospirillales bacterium]